MTSSHRERTATRQQLRGQQDEIEKTSTPNLLDNILRKGVAEPYQPVAPLGRQVQVSRNVSVRELRAEVQTAIVTAIATSDRTELIRPPPNFCRLTLRFVNTACRPTGVGLASDVQLSSHRTHRPPQPFTVWHEETDCHVGKFVRASHVLARLDVPACTSWTASVYLHQRQCSWWVVCWSVRLHVRVPVCVNRSREAARHVSLHVSLHVCGCAVWIMCASYELLVGACGRNKKHLRK